MPIVKEFHLHPLGWENDPEEERFKLSTLDYLSTMTYTNSVLFFKLQDADREKAVVILKEGLERTLSQVRHLVGTIEKDGDGHHSIVKKKHTTVQFVVQYLDSPGDKFPSFTDIYKSHFLSPILGDINVLSNAPMTCGNKPEAHPDNSPAISSFKANFITGGLIFTYHMHHWCNGLIGSNSFVQQLAENCYAVANKTEFPSFDPRCLDRSLFGPLGFDRPTDSQELQIKAPPRPDRNMQHRPSQFLMFHLPKSKAAELKKAALPSDGSQVSTYNALCALMWRVLTRIRVPLYKPDPDYKPVWAEGVSVAKLFTDPPIPARIQGNLQIDIISTTSTSVPQLSLAEVVSEAPLSRIASYTRQMTDSVTREMLAGVLQKYAHVSNKQDLSMHLDSFPPMALLVSDWRSGSSLALDFGFARPSANRHLFGGVPLCQAIVYAAREGPAGDDEGVEVQFTFETELVPELLKDPEWNRYFEFRGVDAWDEESIPKSKL